MKKPAKAARSKVCLLSHHPLVLQELQRLLAEHDYEVELRAVEASQMTNLRRMPLEAAAAFVVDALSSRPANEALVAGLLERYPDSRVIVVAEKFDETNAFPLLHLGAKALLTYEEARQRLPKAVESVLNEGFWVPRVLLSRFIESIVRNSSARRRVHTSAGLSRREQEVLDAVMENLSNKEIAARLNISERTAKFHVSNLLAKFGVRRRADLILMSFQGRSTAA